MNKNILIVDDEKLILENLALLLEDLVDNVYIALDGEKGLEILQKEDIACVISDINMPVKGGIEFIKEAREMDINTPFIFFTAHGNRELMLLAVQYGAFDFLDKPNFDGLEDAVSRGIQAGYKIKESNGEELDTGEMLNEYRELLSQRK